MNGTARILTVSSASNSSLYELLVAFKARTGYGVLCNTSLNFNGRGFINKIKDLSAYAMEHNLDGFVVEGHAYLLKGFDGYQTYSKKLRTVDERTSSDWNPHSDAVHWTTTYAGLNWVARVSSPALMTNDLPATASNPARDTG